MGYNPFQRGLNQSARANARFNTNQTGATMPKGMPVMLTSSGIDLVDVSNEANVDAMAGVLLMDTANQTTASIITAGTIANITTSFDVGTAVYISKVGLLTNVKPSIGVNGFGEGDFVIKVGMIAMNADNSTQKDLLVSIQIMGQL